jgi:hypothetical protein
MRSHLPRTIGAAAALFLAVAGTAQAQGKGHGKGHEKEKDRGQVVQREERRDERRDERREARREDRREVRQSDGRVVLDPRYDPRVDPRYDPRYDERYRNQGRRIPPGLAKKPGGMPPGQYKKIYGADQGANVLRDVMGRRGYTVVRTEDAGNSEYVYYRLRDGSIRRAVVSPGRDRLQFGNVPSSLLSEVLARLY